MKPILLGELFNRLICSLAEAIHPGMRANNGLDQALVARGFRYAIVFYRGWCIFRLCRPRNSEFLVRPISVGGTSGRDQEVIMGDDDALDIFNGSERPVGLSLLWCVSRAVRTVLSISAAGTRPTDPTSAFLPRNSAELT